MKQCSKCKEWQYTSLFVKRKSSKDGLDSWCKSCHKTYQQSDVGKKSQSKRSRTYRSSTKGKEIVKQYTAKYRKTEKEKLAARKRRARYAKSDYGKRALVARMALNYRVLKGEICHISKLQCCYCSKQAEHYHHHLGYDKKYWYDVIPVCIKCHLKEHKEQANEAIFN